MPKLFSAVVLVAALSQVACVEQAWPADAASAFDAGRVGAGDAGSTATSETTRAARRACQSERGPISAFIPNARDLGGIPLAGDSAVACGALFRGASLAGLSPAGCEEFAALGIRTVVDLRTEAERISAPSAACAREQAALVLAPLPIPYALSPADYLADLNATESVASAFAAFGDEAAYPIYLHCTYGRDRSGVLTAVVLRALGASRQEIFADYELTNASGFGTAPASLRAVLDELDLRGGAAAYLDSAGVSRTELATLRASAVVAGEDR